MKASNAPANACDYADSYAWGTSTPVVLNSFDFAFIADFATEVNIRSVYFDVMAKIKADVLVWPKQEKLSNVEERYICRKEVDLNGVINCPFTIRGKRLVLWPRAYWLDERGVPQQ